MTNPQPSTEGQIKQWAREKLATLQARQKQEAYDGGSLGTAPVNQVEVEALTMLASPDWIVVKRETAEHALALAQEAGEHHERASNTSSPQRSDELLLVMLSGLKKARRLLGLEEGT